jgi:CelD/BcsL family acetyltransferase involved in cellulose biosynthesis
VKTGFDPDAGRFAPGIMIRHDMIERAFSAGLRSYEFLGHDDAWKLRWTSERRERVVIRTFAPTPCGRLNWLSVARARPAAKRLLRRG